MWRDDGCRHEYRGYPFSGFIQVSLCLPSLCIPVLSVNPECQSPGNQQGKRAENDDGQNVCILFRFGYSSPANRAGE